MAITPYSTAAEIEAERARLQAETAQRTKINRGQSILLAFWRQHSDLLLNEANERIVHEFIGTRDFSLEMLNGWLPEFEARLAKVQQPRETPAYVTPEPKPQPLVPFSRRQLLQMDAASLRELKNRSEDTHIEINRILNSKET